MYKLLIQYLKSMVIVSLDLFVNGRVAAGRDGFFLIIFEFHNFHKVYWSITSKSLPHMFAFFLNFINFDLLNVQTVNRILITICFLVCCFQ